MSTDERLRRWQLVLGEQGAEGMTNLVPQDAAIEQALAALYDIPPPQDGERRAGLGGSSPSVSRWLGDIRRYFPSSVVQVMQRDAIERLDLKRLMLEPEMLETVEPDIALVTTILSLKHALPATARETARGVVRKLVEQLVRKLERPTQRAVSGALNKATRTRRPRHQEIDWHRTIRANLRHYQPEYKTVVPETRIGYGRKRSALRDVILCIDQSGSMAGSVVYSSIFGAVLASMPALRTRLIVFDTNVVDLTEEIEDPVEVLFAVQLGGGTDINRAVAYGQSQVRSPADTIYVLISDLYEGGVEEELLRRAGSLIASGVQLIVLLALSDEGAPAYDRALASKLAAMGAPSFACTPDLFPDLMAAAIQRRDLNQWAAAHGIVSAAAAQ